MRFRFTRPEDLAVARDLVLPAYRYPPNLLAALPAMWTELLNAGQLNTGVVEDPTLSPGERVRGVGLSVFVTDAFAEDVLESPRPYLNVRLHEMIRDGRSPVLDRREIAKANAGDGLSLLPLHFATPSLNFDNPTVMRTLWAAQDLFRLVHAGYRVKRIVKEVVSHDLRRFMIASGMTVHTDYRDLAVGKNLASLSEDDRPCLLAVDHADLPLGSPLSMMFVTGEVRFRFSPAEQKLLLCALLRETDEDIAADLGLTPDTLRKHWRSIYERVLTADPYFFPEEPERNGRGRGKRRHLLRYLALHMEELRPYARRLTGRRSLRESAFAPGRPAELPRT